MDKSDKNKKLPFPDMRPYPRPWAGGQLKSFPTTKGASPNEFCEECGCKTGGCCGGKHMGNPCGGKK